jgi:hypothetical protein
MMTTFNDREKSFENKFAHDEALRFRATARRNKHIGLWAAEKLGKTGSDAEAYVNAVILADFEEAGDADIVRKLRKDFDAAGLTISDLHIAHTLDELMAKAVIDVQKE